MKTIQGKARALLTKAVSKSSIKDVAKLLDKWDSQLVKWLSGGAMSKTTAENIIRKLGEK